MAMRGVAACDQDHAAGEAVQSMHDAGPQFAPHARKLPKAMQHGVDQRPGVLAGAGVNHHARWFVDGDDVGVFIQDFERQVLGGGSQRRQFARLNLDALGALQQVGAFFGAPFTSTRPCSIQSCSRDRLYCGRRSRKN